MLKFPDRTVPFANFQDLGKLALEMGVDVSPSRVTREGENPADELQQEVPVQSADPDDDGAEDSGDHEIEDDGEPGRFVSGSFVQPCYVVLSVDVGVVGDVEGQTMPAVLADGVFDCCCAGPRQGMPQVSLSAEEYPEEELQEVQAQLSQIHNRVEEKQKEHLEEVRQSGKFTHWHFSEGPTADDPPQEVSPTTLAPLGL